MDRRKAERTATRSTVRVETGPVALNCEMRNLSQSGCMIACAALPVEVGDAVTVHLMHGLTVRGEVSWQMGESVGVFFLEPIPLVIVRHFALDDWMLKADWSVPRPGDRR